MYRYVEASLLACMPLDWKGKVERTLFWLNPYCTVFVSKYWFSFVTANIAKKLYLAVPPPSPRMCYPQGAFVGTKEMLQIVANFPVAEVPLVWGGGCLLIFIPYFWGLGCLQWERECGKILLSYLTYFVFKDNT